MQTELKITDINNLFTDRFIESKAYFMYCFNKVPSITYISKVIQRPMTIAEISNQNDRTEERPKVEVIGFRRSVVEN